MLDLIRKTFKPEVFQGNLDRERYFEGWYIKLVDRDQRHRLAVIPGISLDRAGGTSHAFVQVIDGNSAETSYFEYSLEEFKTDIDTFRVTIGQNTFSLSGMTLDLHDGQRKIRGNVSFNGLVGWPRRLLAPGAMGWYSFVPRMECYHGLVSIDHVIHGRITMDVPIDFASGRGYIEKDWGTSFPSAYIWMQSNHFGVPGVSLMASIARIPWLGSSFTGLLAIFLHDGKFYTFASYTGAIIEKLELGEEAAVHYVLCDKKYQLEVFAKRTSLSSSPRDSFGMLKSPIEGAMKGRIAETLTAEISVQLKKRRRLGRRESVIFEGVGQSAGLEIEANRNELFPSK